MRRLAAAAAALAAACHPAKPPPPAPPPASPVARPPAVAPAPPPDAGVDGAIVFWEDAALRAADPSSALLDAARARRARIARSERVPEPDAGAIGQDAQACAADAHRSWAARFPGAAAQVNGTRTAAEVYAQVGAPAAEALYLEAVCGAIWARMQGFTPLIERRDELVAELRRVAELAPGLDGAGAQRELGTLHAALPTYAGGDLAEARKWLDEAVQRAPGDMRNHLALARTVAVKSQDRALFRQQLAIVVQGDDPAAAAQATALLQREDELFGPAEAAQPVPGGPGK